MTAIAHRKSARTIGHFHPIFCFALLLWHNLRSQVRFNAHETQELQKSVVHSSIAETAIMKTTSNTQQQQQHISNNTKTVEFLSGGARILCHFGKEGEERVPETEK